MDRNSKYADWYNILEFDDPSTPERTSSGMRDGEVIIHGCLVFKKDIIPAGKKKMPFEGNLHSESLRKHIFDVTRRWLDPDGDGDHGDGVDGFRLDVAGEIPMGFWREYRKIVGYNPGFPSGEIGGGRPDKLMNPSVFLKKGTSLMQYELQVVQDREGFFWSGRACT